MRLRIGLLARALALTMTLMLAVAGSAHGHALYERSQPASGGQLGAPGEIQVWFTEAVEAGFSKVEVLDSARRRVNLEDSRAVPGEPRSLVLSVGELPDGTYTVSWQTLSAVDGHVVRGVFPLVVGAGGLTGALDEAPAYVPAVGDVAARWLGYLAALALMGGFIFRGTVLGPALTKGGGRREWTDVARDYDARFRGFGLVASAVLVLATVAGMVLQATTAANVPSWQAIGEPLARLLSTRLGLLWEARLALAALLALLLWRGREPALGWVGALLGGALLWTISLNSHAAALPTGTWLAVAMDWLHQVAAAAWVGGLFAFALLVPPIVSPLRPPAATELLAAVLPRFSKLAVVAVVVLAFTGAFHSWLQVTSLPALGTFYGGSLIVKLVLLAPILGLGAANLLLARPRMAKSTAERGRAPGGALSPLVRRFQWAVRAEAALAIGVLLATAALTASEPARETYARQPRPIELAGQIEDIEVHLRVAPGRPGANTVDVRLEASDGQPPRDVQRVTLRFTYLDQDLGSGTLTLEPRDDGRYGAISSNLSTDGNWQIEALVRRRGREDARTGFRVEVASADVAAQPPSLEVLAPTSVGSRQTMAVGLIALGVVLAFLIARRREVRRYERLALYATSFAVAMIGGVLYTRAAALPVTPPDVRELRSPFAPDAASLARGQQVYEQLCASCHGVDGRGDGPVGRTLRPRPADFRVHMTAGHTDGELFNWVTNGVPGTAMPAYDGQLSETDRWHVINYIRGFAPRDE